MTNTINVVRTIANLTPAGGLISSYLDMPSPKEKQKLGNRKQLVRIFSDSQIPHYQALAKKMQPIVNRELKEMKSEKRSTALNVINLTASVVGTVIPGAEALGAITEMATTGGEALNILKFFSDTANIKSTLKKLFMSLVLPVTVAVVPMHVVLAAGGAALGGAAILDASQKFNQNR